MKMNILVLAIIVSIFMQTSCFQSHNSNGLKVKKIDGSYIQLMTSIANPAIIIFSSRNSCHDCYKKIKNSIDSFNKIKNTNVKVNIILQDHGNYQNRENYEYMIDLISPADVYFDIENNNCDDESLFKKYKVELTPCVLLINKDKTKYIDNEELFGSGDNNKIMKVFEEFYSE